MFTGLVTSTHPLTNYQKLTEKLYKIQLPKPQSEDDFVIGESIALNGVCLTVSSIESEFLSFDVGEETLKITGWNEAYFKAQPQFHIERALRLGDRLGGHIVLGHVDEPVKVLKISSEQAAANHWITLELTALGRLYIWPKSSVCLGGVSLTVNDVTPVSFNVCLIPETINKTCLSTLEPGDFVNVEYDFYAKAIVHQSTQVKAAYHEHS